MSEFEKWFEDQDFYTNMRFIHGDKLFDKDGDVYRVLSVQMTYQGWSSQRQRSKDEFVALTQEWHTKGWNNRQGEIDDLKAQLNNMEACYIQVKKERDELHSATDKALTHVKRQTECFRDLKTDATDMQTKNWWQAKVQILNPIRRMLEAALRGVND